VLFSGLWCYAAARVHASERELCRWIALAVIGFVLYGLLINVAVYGDPMKLALSHEESTRPRLVFGGLHPLTLGDVMAIGAIATVMSDMRLRWKAVALLILLTLLQLTDATGARILFIVTIGVYLNMRAIRNRHAALWLALLWLGVLVAGGLALLFKGEAIGRLLENERLSSLTGRSQLWSAIWQSGLANTWLGTGFDAARGAIEDVFGVAYQVHNQYLGVLVELGYAGVFLFAAVFLIWAVVVVRSRSIMAWCLALYVVGINMNNASMFTKGSIIFLTILCYVSALFRVGAARVQLAPASRRTAYPSGRPGWRGDGPLAAPAHGLRR
jgi:O-antigen ligase